MAKARRSTEKREVWTLALQKYRESVFSVRAFCECKGLASKRGQVSCDVEIVRERHSFFSSS